MTVTVTAAFCPLSLQTLFDRTGTAIGGAQLFFYDAGTTSARTVYRDSGLTLEYPTPVLADAYGRVPPIFVGVGSYKIVARDASSNFVFQVDGIPGGVSVTSSSTPTTGSYWKTGDLKAAYVSDSQDGFVIANGLSIGNASSSASSRADADCQALFIALWNADASLTVSGGRGTNATADWNGGKTIALPDIRGRVLAGCDGMGNALAGRLSLSDTIGSAGGAEAITLDATQIGAHSHAVTVAGAGAHTPAGTITGDGSHTNSGTVDANGGHQHNLKENLLAAGGGSASVPFASGSGGILTEPVSDHQHTFTTNFSGTHLHGFTGNSVGDHVHTASSANAGGGLAHYNVQPTILVYFQIKL